MSASQLPIIDIAPLVTQSGSRAQVAEALGRACTETGFFYIVNHGIDLQLQTQLEDLSKRFFALDQDSKLAIAMSKAGRAWRGYFPVGGELTAGQADLKEGLYFGSELNSEHPDVRAGLPLHGANLFPQSLPEFKPVILHYLQVMTALGHSLMQGIALSLGLDAEYFYQRFTRDPLILFRIFHYPPPATHHELLTTWGVGEHTDYGVLTILKQDHNGGLEVRAPHGWIEAPPVPNSFVCNIGDMLDLMTGGIYRSTPHRVRNRSGQSRLSWPFFFDPNFHAKMAAVPVAAGLKPRLDAENRWDQTNVHAFRGSYGDYVLAKVAKVFPELNQKALTESSSEQD